MKTFNRLGMAVVVAAAALAFGSVTPTRAAVIQYTLSGVTDGPPGDSFSGYFDFDTALGMTTSLSIMVSDGPGPASFTTGDITGTNSSTNLQAIDPITTNEFIFIFSGPLGLSNLNDTLSGNSSGNSVYFIPTPNDYTFNLTGAVTELDITSTPLPASLPLLASGLGTLGLLGWRRKRKAAALAA